MRLLMCVALLGFTVSATGCAMCCAPDDPNYAAYGGRWERHDAEYGRVGSAFTPAGSPVDVGEVVGETYLETPYVEGEPTPAEKIDAPQGQPVEEDPMQGEQAFAPLPISTMR